MLDRVLPWVTGLSLLLAFGCFLAAIWLGDDRWGQTGVVLFLAGVVAGLVWAAREAE